MKTIIHLELKEINEAVWDLVTGAVKTGYEREFTEPYFYFTYDDNNTVTGIDINVGVIKEVE